MPTEVGDIIRVTALNRFDLLDDVVQVWHWRVEELFASDTAMINAVRTRLAQKYNTIATYVTNKLTPGSCAFYNVRKKEILGTYTWDTAWLGGTDDVNEPLPPVVSVLTIARTIYSRLQGRKYFAGFTEQRLANGYWGEPLGTACANIHEDLVTDTVTGTPGILQGGVYSPTKDQLILPTGVTFAIQPAYQRRRRFGRGS